jgi:hypothetical protein
VKGPRSSLYEALETATAAQEEPLSIVISTQAPTDGDLLSVLIDDALGGHDPRTVLGSRRRRTISTLLEEAIRAANPAFDVFMNKPKCWRWPRTRGGCRRARLSLKPRPEQAS